MRNEFYTKENFARKRHVVHTLIHDLESSSERALFVIRLSEITDAVQHPLAEVHQFAYEQLCDMELRLLYILRYQLPIYTNSQPIGKKKNVENIIVIA